MTCTLFSCRYSTSCSGVMSWSSLIAPAPLPLVAVDLSLLLAFSLGDGRQHRVPVAQPGELFGELRVIGRSRGPDPSGPTVSVRGWSPLASSHRLAELVRRRPDEQKGRAVDSR